jgi:hypothetical protein
MNPAPPPLSADAQPQRREARRDRRHPLRHTPPSHSADAHLGARTASSSVGESVSIADGDVRAPNASQPLQHSADVPATVGAFWEGWEYWEDWEPPRTARPLPIPPTLA